MSALYPIAEGETEPTIEAIAAIIEPFEVSYFQKAKEVFAQGNYKHCLILLKHVSNDRIETIDFTLSVYYSYWRSFLSFDIDKQRLIIPEQYVAVMRQNQSLIEGIFETYSHFLSSISYSHYISLAHIYLLQNQVYRALNILEIAYLNGFKENFYVQLQMYSIIRNDPLYDIECSASLAYLSKMVLSDMDIRHNMDHIHPANAMIFLANDYLMKAMNCVSDDPRISNKLLFIRKANELLTEAFVLYHQVAPRKQSQISDWFNDSLLWRGITSDIIQSQYLNFVEVGYFEGFTRDRLNDLIVQDLEYHLRLFGHTEEEIVQRLMKANIICPYNLYTRDYLLRYEELQCSESHPIRDHFDHQIETIVRVQSLLRGFILRKQWGKQRLRLLKLQQYRAANQAKAAKQRKTLENRLMREVLRMWRLYSRFALSTKIYAAIVIQTHIRGYLARRRTMRIIARIRQANRVFYLASDVNYHHERVFALRRWQKVFYVAYRQRNAGIIVDFIRSWKNKQSYELHKHKMLKVVMYRNRRLIRQNWNRFREVYIVVRQDRASRTIVNFIRFQFKRYRLGKIQSIMKDIIRKERIQQLQSKFKPKCLWLLRGVMRRWETLFRRTKERRERQMVAIYLQKSYYLFKARKEIKRLIYRKELQASYTVRSFHQSMTVAWIAWRQVHSCRRIQRCIRCYQAKKRLRRLRAIGRELIRFQHHRRLKMMRYYMVQCWNKDFFRKKQVVKISAINFIIRRFRAFRRRIFLNKHLKRKHLVGNFLNSIAMSVRRHYFLSFRQLGIIYLFTKKLTRLFEIVQRVWISPRFWSWKTSLRYLGVFRDFHREIHVKGLERRFWKSCSETIVIHHDYHLQQRRAILRNLMLKHRAGELEAQRQLEKDPQTKMMLGNGVDWIESAWFHHWKNTLARATDQRIPFTAFRSQLMLGNSQDDQDGIARQGSDDDDLSIESSLQGSVQLLAGEESADQPSPLATPPVLSAANSFAGIENSSPMKIRPSDRTLSSVISPITPKGPSPARRSSKLHSSPHNDPSNSGSGGGNDPSRRQSRFGLLRSQGSFRDTGGSPPPVAAALRRQGSIKLQRQSSEADSSRLLKSRQSFRGKLSSQLGGGSGKDSHSHSTNDLLKLEAQESRPVPPTDTGNSDSSQPQLSFAAMLQQFSLLHHIPAARPATDPQTATVASLSDFHEEDWSVEENGFQCHEKQLSHHTIEAILSISYLHMAKAFRVWVTIYRHAHRLRRQKGRELAALLQPKIRAMVAVDIQQIRKLQIWARRVVARKRVDAVRNYSHRMEELTLRLKAKTPCKLFTHWERLAKARQAARLQLQHWIRRQLRQFQRMLETRGKMIAEANVAMLTKRELHRMERQLEIMRLCKEAVECRLQRKYFSLLYRRFFDSVLTKCRARKSQLGTSPTLYPSRNPVRSALDDTEGSPMKTIKTIDKIARIGTSKTFHNHLYRIRQTGVFILDATVVSHGDTMNSQTVLTHEKLLPHEIQQCLHCADTLFVQFLTTALLDDLIRCFQGRKLIISHCNLPQYCSRRLLAYLSCHSNGRLVSLTLDRCQGLLAAAYGELDVTWDRFYQLYDLLYELSGPVELSIDVQSLGYFGVMLVLLFLSEAGVAYSSQEGHSLKSFCPLHNLKILIVSNHHSAWPDSFSLSLAQLGRNNILQELRLFGAIVNQEHLKTLASLLQGGLKALRVLELAVDSSLDLKEWTRQFKSIRPPLQLFWYPIDRPVELSSVSSPSQDPLDIAAL